MTSDQRRETVVWDLPIRVFHWSIVLLFLVTCATWQLDWMEWHAYAGDAVLALLLFRLVWGFVGSETARFGRFISSPRSALHHLRHTLRREPDTQVGHNPAGGWMVLLLLTLMLVQSVSGILVNNDVADEGPLTERAPAWLLNLFSTLHDWLWIVLLATITLHLLAIATYAMAKGHNLLRPMLTGRKYIPPDRDAPRLASPWHALLLLCGSAVVTALLAAYL